jgi:hypothetical protein
MPPTSPPSQSTIPPSWKAHPLWTIRKYTLLTLFLTLLLSGSLTHPGLVITFLIISIVLIIYDLSAYITTYLRLLTTHLSDLEAALRAANSPSSRDDRHSCEQIPDPQDGDDKPPAKKWPRRMIMLADVFLAATFFLLALVVVISTVDDGHWRGSASIVAESYCSMGLVVLSVLHGIAYWRECKAMNARRRERRKAEIRREVLGLVGDRVEESTSVGCEGCGRVVVLPVGRRERGWVEKVFGEDVSDAVREGIGRVRSDVASGEEHASLIRTPSSSSNGADEPFEHLGSMESGYGLMEESRESLSGPVHVVKKKRSKRAIGEEWDKKGKGKEALIVDVEA